jgi:glycosyltransferase involved in cell wall biosynthesis
MIDRILVVVPAWNEQASIAQVIKDLKDHSFEVLVVDDGSTDETFSAAKAAGAITLRLPFNLGVGAALRCGFKYAVQHGYHAVVQCDADGQHPVGHIESLIKTAEQGELHMVIGSRFLHDTGKMELSLIRRFAMRILSSSATRACGTSITDATSGFRVICSPLLNELAEKLPPYYLGDTYEALVSAGRAGYRIKEIPAPLMEREHGKSSARPIKAARLTVKAILSAVLRVEQKLDGPAPTN